MTLISLDGELKRSDKVVLVMIASALACVVLSLIFGALGALYYIPGVSAKMVQYGVSLVQLRPLHTSFASSWLFLGAATCVYRFLFEKFGEPPWSTAVVSNDLNVGNLICHGPGMSNDAHWHPDFDEWWTILKGELTWNLGEKRPIYEVKEGDKE